MILFLLPALDILTAVVLVLHVHFGMFSLPVVLIHGVYLAMKGVLFSATDNASRVDLICGVYVIIVAFGLLRSELAAWAVFIWLAQKAVFALVPVR